MKLSEEILDAIDGATESIGRDTQLTEWARKAEVLEWKVERTLGTPENDYYLRRQIAGNRWLADQYKDITDEPLPNPPF